MIEILTGDAIERLRELPNESIHCCVTSPPYWGLRDYGTAEWGPPVLRSLGEAECDHIDWKQMRGSDPNHKQSTNNNGFGGVSFGKVCGLCGAKRIDAQLGLEKTPDEYVAKMVEVFREVRRVLRKDGTLWLNLGDSYNAAREGGHAGGTNGVSKPENAPQRSGVNAPGLKPKDLCGIPWAVAKALQQPYYTGRIKKLEERTWLSAIIEGEGCMFIHKRNAGDSAYSQFTKKDGTVKTYNRTNDTFGVGLEVSSTDKSIVDRCLEITGIGSVCTQSPEQNARRKQKIWRWNCRTNECKWIIRELYPHLIAKQHEARLVLGCPSSGDKAKAAHESLKAIHQGGEPTIDFPAPASMFEEGWYLRCDIIWAKKNCMPESCTDRPTKSHEYVFLLTKASSYFYDAEAIKEQGEKVGTLGHLQGGNGERAGTRQGLRREYVAAKRLDPDCKALDSLKVCGDGLYSQYRNKRSVWTIATAPYPEAHFATYPPDLVKPCIMAGTSAKGCCAKCGAPWERVVERSSYERDHTDPKKLGTLEHHQSRGSGGNEGMIQSGAKWNQFKAENPDKTIGWQATCGCVADIIPCTVLDPFAGSGTTGMVALELGRKAVLIELNPKYVQLIKDRCNVTPGLALA